MGDPRLSRNWSRLLIIILLAINLIAPRIPQVQGWEGDYIDSFDTSVQSGDPSDLTTDGSYIWIIDYNDDEVYKYEMNGDYITSWDTSIQSGDALGIATDGSYIWIVDYADTEVYKYSMAGVYTDEHWDTSAHGALNFGIATDGSYIWIVDKGDEEVYKYEMNGDYITSWSTSGQSGDPYSITTDSLNLWIIDFYDDEVYKYEMNGDYVDSWDTSGQAGSFASGITTDGIYIWTSDYAVDEVYKYDGPPPEGTGEYQVSQNTDDCYTDATGFWSTNNNVDITGDYDGTNRDYESGMRFTGINIPNGAIVQSAYLKLESGGYQGVIPDTYIKGQDADDTITFSSRVDYLARDRTSELVPWTPIEWVSGVEYASPDIKSIIQVIVNREGWESGNSIVLFWYDTEGYTEQCRIFATAHLSDPADAPKLEITWGTPTGVENKCIDPSDSTVDDEQWFFLNASIEILTNTSTFLFNRIDLDPTGLNLSCSYTNATDTFVEESDPNNYLELDVVISVKTDENETFVRIDYYLRLHPNVTKDGLYNVTVYSTASGDLDDTDTFTDVFTLTIRTPSAPTLLFGAGFNSSSPYVELHWTHNLLIFNLFEVQNSSNDADWTYLGTNTTAWYTDSTVSNGTERYYKVRACRDTGVGWKNTTFTNSTFETVYFIPGVGNGAAPPANYPAIDKIEFNTTIATYLASIDGAFSDVEGLSGYIFWNNATSPPGGVNSSFTALIGTSDSALENITLPSADTKVGVKYFVNDTDGNWGVDTLVIFPSEAGVTYVTGSVGIFLMAFIILLPIIFYAVKRK